ncbi:MAG: hypothetical protein JO306_02680 [Gemmatimonadetes bacterium]|nr:hypothetical protein [Gemmatimonadota bacterium]
MKKMKLDLDTLAVNTFETAAPVHISRGTVQGHFDHNPLNRDWQPSEQSALACATGGYNVCGGPTVTGCVDYTGGVYIMTTLCP